MSSCTCMTDTVIFDFFFGPVAGNLKYSYVPYVSLIPT